MSCVVFYRKEGPGPRSRPEKTEHYFTFLLNKINFLQKGFWSQLVFCLMGLNSTKAKIVAITLLCGLP